MKKIFFDVVVTGRIEPYVIILPEGASDLSVVRAAKRAAGWSGARCRTEKHGDFFALFRPNDRLDMFILRPNDRLGMFILPKGKYK